MSVIHTETEKFVIELETADGGEYESITINEPINGGSITTDLTAAVLTAAKTQVAGGGTLIKTKHGYDVDHIKQSYFVATQKTWIDNPV